MTNPFTQAPDLTELSWVVPYAQALALEAGMEEGALAQSRFIVDGDPDYPDAASWRVQLLVDASQVAEMTARLAILRQVHGLEFPEPQVASVAPRDWVAQVQASFKPITAGRFYVHGSHIDEVPQVGAIPIRMDAGAAFGTGEHETTTGCLLALDALARTHRFMHPLDMGCGSGILAIAAAKIWRVPVLAVDVDAMSVQVARANMRLNGVQKLVRCEVGDGYRAVRGEYDLIIANILARPLMQMAGDLAVHLALGGTVVLSGLLTRQEPMVLWAHRQFGLRLQRRIVRGGWSTLILR